MILTVDIERDWGMETTKNFQFLSGLFNWLEDTKSSATFFVAGNIAEPLNEVGVPKRVEIASHTMNHVNLQKVSENDVINEVQESKATLESIFNTKVNGFRAPYFLAPENLWEVLSQNGYTYSSSLAVGWFPKRYYNRIKPKPFKRNGVTELPVPKFRFIPFAFGLPFMRLMWPISKLLTPRNPYMFYYHPTELLAEKPGPQEGKYVSLLYGLHRGQRARRLLYDFLEKKEQTTSIEKYLKTYSGQMKDRTKKLPAKISMPKTPAKEKLKVKEKPTESGQGIPQREDVEVPGLEK